MKKKNKENFHLIGIGGIGMSALARFLVKKKCQVSGSDLSTEGEILKIEKEGVRVYKSHFASHIQNKETVVVYSTAISDDNPEMQQAKKLGCTLWHRSDLLAYLMQSYQSIAITGTHGKTSTSSLLSHILVVADESPSFVVGGLLKPQNTNSSVGTGRFFVAEADESDRSFFKYDPDYSVITNLEADHLNHYADINEIKEAFKKFIEKVKNKETLFWCRDCPNLLSMNLPGISYGFDESCHLKIKNFKQKGLISYFDISFEGFEYKEVELSMFGKHNALNAAALFGLSLKLGLSEDKIREGLRTFKGVKRRAEFIGEASNIQIYDDYAHHPTEVACLLKSFRKAFPKRRIIALFQPHRYSRFIPFKDDFASSFKKASEVWITDIYAAGEKIDNPINLQEYAKEIESSSSVKAWYVKKEEKLETFLRNIKPHDIFITIGAGDITKFSYEASRALKESNIKMKIGLIQGMSSYEHYVSLISSRFYQNNFDPDLYEMNTFQISPDNEWFLLENEKKTPLSIQKAIEMLLECSCIFPITHGRHGEDGMLAAFLQTLNIPYCGTHYSQGSFNMNKIWMKLFVKALHIDVPKGLSLSASSFRQNIKGHLRRIEKCLEYPIVVKPASMGSTIGVTFTKNQNELRAALEFVFQLDENAVIEERIYGRELEVSCLETENGLKVTGPGEVKSDKRSYDYQAKYSSNPIEKIVEPNLDLKIIKRCQTLARKIYLAMQIKSYARIDFFLTKKNRVIFAEVNTQPGTTPRSLFQRTLIASGMSPKEIVDQMVIDALYRNRLENRKSIQIRQFLKSIKNVTHS